MAQSSYDYLIEEGMQKGIEETKKEMIIEMIKSLPELSDEKIAAIGKVEVSFVKELRKKVNQK